MSLPPFTEVELDTIESWLQEDDLLMVSVEIPHGTVFDYLIHDVETLQALVEKERDRHFPEGWPRQVWFHVFRGRDIFPVRGAADEQLIGRALADLPSTGDILILDPSVTYPVPFKHLYDGWTREHMVEGLRAVAGQQVVVGPHPRDPVDEEWDRTHPGGTVRTEAWVQTR